MKDIGVTYRDTTELRLVKAEALLPTVSALPTNFAYILSEPIGHVDFFRRRLHVELRFF